MNRDEILAVVRDELARFEHRCRVGGHSLDKAVDAHLNELLTYGISGAPGSTDEERKARLAECFAYADRGRIRAAALTRLSAILLRVLRVIGGKPIFDDEVIPPTMRQTKELLQGESSDSRESIVLDRETIEREAGKHGILAKESNGCESQSKE